MPYLEEIICLINENYNVVFKDKNFAQKKIYGITQPIARKNEIIPAYLEGRDWKYVGPDDTQNLILYHKLNSNVYEMVQNSSYGRRGGMDKCTSNLSLVVFGLRNKLNVSQYELERLVNQYLIEVISKQDLTKLKLQSVNIAPVSTNMDMNSVFNQEFKNIAYNLNEKHILFELKYQIEAIYIKDCFNNC